MSELLKKATSNYNAAELLIDRKNYPPSIHCAYYSCLQIILFLINSKLSKAWTTYQDGLDATKVLNPETHTKSLHNLYISFIIQDINRTDINSRRRFSTDIGILKKNRNDSDYKELEITSAIADNSLELARKINQQLLKHYEL